jgi:DNA (cytosine-5)-methyltransferase 1
VSPRYGELFAGIGGMSLGLERAGWEPAWFAENDAYCSRVLAKHWPDIPNLGDVTAVDWSEVEHVELVCGGFPCQPVSRAGLRRLSEDERWLWPEALRCVRGLRPRLVLLENTAGLLDAGMGCVLGDLASIGYDAEWDGLPAVAFGADHQRDRVFIVAYPTGAGLEGRARFFEASRTAFAESPRRSWLPTTHPRPRNDDGLPLEVDRRRALGNAVVPQVAEWIGRRLLEVA